VLSKTSGVASRLRAFSVFGSDSATHQSPTCLGTERLDWNWIGLDLNKRINKARHSEVDGTFGYKTWDVPGVRVSERVRARERDEMRRARAVTPLEERDRVAHVGNA
jgi:hypothetical protein